MGHPSKNRISEAGETLRTCSVCKIEKTLEFFSPSKPAGYKAACKKCSAEKFKIARLKNPEKFCNRERCRKRRILVASFKDRPCQDCKREFPAVCMDFDHRPGTIKTENISSMVYGKRVSLETLREEMEKCDLVCACCHRIRTQSRSLKRPA